MKRPTIGYYRIKASYDFLQDKLKGDEQLLEIIPKEGLMANGPVRSGSAATVIVQKPEYINRLKKDYPEIKVSKGRLPTLLGIRDDEYDVVVAFRILERLNDDDLFLREAARVLHQSGTLFLSVPNPDHLLVYNPFFYQEYTVEHIRDLLSPYFQNVEIYGIQGSDRIKEQIKELRNRVLKVEKRKIIRLMYKLPRSVVKPLFRFLTVLFKQSRSFQYAQAPLDIKKEDILITNQVEGAMEFLIVAKH